MEDKQTDRSRRVNELREGLQVMADEYSLEYYEEDCFAKVRGNECWLFVGRLEEGVTYSYLNAIGQQSSEGKLNFAIRRDEAGFTDGNSFMTVQAAVKCLLTPLLPII